MSRLALLRLRGREGGGVAPPPPPPWQDLECLKLPARRHRPRRPAVYGRLDQPQPSHAFWCCRPTRLRWERHGCTLDTSSWTCALSPCPSQALLINQRQSELQFTPVPRYGWQAMGHLNLLALALVRLVSGTLPRSNTPRLHSHSLINFHGQSPRSTASTCGSRESH